MTNADPEWLKTAPLDDVLEHWRLVAAARHDGLHYDPTPQMWRHFSMVREHAIEGVNIYKSVPFYALPLVMQARRIVELGCSFSDYPKSYGDPPSPWRTSTDRDEGVVSTRIILAACDLLKRFGIDATLTSVDIRNAESPVECATTLLTELGLVDYWRTAFGVDSLDWLRDEAARIQAGAELPVDMMLIDGNHTYDQVSRELAGTLPLMSPKGIILVDDCYDTNYAHGVDWIPEDSEEGLRRGGEHGSVLEFLDAHPEWKVEWLQYMCLLTRER